MIYILSKENLDLFGECIVFIKSNKTINITNENILNVNFNINYFIFIFKYFNYY